MKFTTGPEDRGLRLDHFLAHRLPHITRSQIQHLNQLGAVLIDGRVEKSGYRIRGSERIDISLNSLESTPLTAEQIPLQIYFEDEDLAIVEKPAGLVVHPGAGVQRGTLVHALLYHFRNLSDFGGEGRPGIVHRLDKWTSGLLVIAKNNAAHGLLGKAFQDRKVVKSYIALVHGRLQQKSGALQMPIGRHSTIRTRMAAVTEKGRSALTQYKVLEEFREFSLVEVRIQTGRTHQIRVHFSAVGHPVVGDDVYGERVNAAFSKKFGPLGRYFLHAAYLSFAHPATGKELEFHSPLPPELQNFLKRIR